MSRCQDIIQTIILFLVFHNNILCQNICSIGNRKGECVPRNECELYNQVINKKLLDHIVSLYFNSIACENEGSNKVCCEKDIGHCITPENKPGACMELSRCEPLLDFVNGVGWNEDAINYLNMSECMFGSTILIKICCPIFSHSITGRYRGVKKPELPQPGSKTGQCGVEDSIHDKIAYGSRAGFGQYPWAVLLQYGNGEFGCGGSLIHSKYVLTAAHCVTGQKIELMKYVTSVRLGEQDLSETNDWEADELADAVEDIGVEEIIPHPAYNNYTKQNDIAVIRLNKSAPYSKFIKPICLPTSISREDLKRKELTIVGWGSTEYQWQSHFKLFARIPYFDFQQCNTILAEYGYGLDDGQFCAGVNGSDACRGDSGGPLMYFENLPKAVRVYYQAGIISFGHFRCGNKIMPGVYTNVSHFLPWILENIHE